MYIHCFFHVLHLVVTDLLTAVPVLSDVYPLVVNLGQTLKTDPYAMVESLTFI